MTEEYPDNWVVLKITVGEETIYKCLAGWSGGYLGSDCWKLNSGIVRVDRKNKYSQYIEFYGRSGSVYHCHKNCYGLRMNNAGIFNELKEKFGDGIELMPEDTDWFEINW